MLFSENEKTLITKENSYVILKAFAKEYKKEYGNYPLEIIIVGGGSILLNYGFREYTQDLDIMVKSMDDIKKIAYRVAEAYNLPDKWLNTDFTRTASYSDKLREVSRHFRSFNNGSLEIRMITEEYLIAMKMVSARDYRNDMSDIIGIICSMKKNNIDISWEKVSGACQFLYPDRKLKEAVQKEAKAYLTLTAEELEIKYSEIKSMEEKVGERLVWIDGNYPKTVTEESVASITQTLKEKIRARQDK